jgi:hypothetical protein
MIFLSEWLIRRALETPTTGVYSRAVVAVPRSARRAG